MPPMGYYYKDKNTDKIIVKNEPANIAAEIADVHLWQKYESGKISLIELNMSAMAITDTKVTAHRTDTGSKN